MSEDDWGIAAPDLETRLAQERDQVVGYDILKQTATSLTYLLRQLVEGAASPDAARYWETRIALVRAAVDAVRADDTPAVLAVSDVLGAEFEQLIASYDSDA